MKDSRKTRKEHEERKAYWRNRREEEMKQIYTKNCFGKEFTRKQYCEFMFNTNNSLNCKNCPENKAERSGLPCGQQNCWVDCHCKEAM